MSFSATRRLSKVGLGLILALSLAACQHKQPADTIVLVNGQVITASDLNFELLLEEKGADRQALLEDLIDQDLILQQADKDGIKLSADDLEAQVELARAGTPLNEFQDALKARGLTYDQWRERVARQALCDEVVRRQIRTQLVIKPQDLKDYYWEHVTEFRRPESVRLRQIYCKTRSRIEQADSELGLGEPFESVALKYSQSPEAAQGGDLGWVGRKALPAKIAKAAFALKKGRISPIVTTAYGYHILQVEERRDAESMSLDEAAPKIHEALLREHEQPRYRDWLFELRSHAQIQRIDLKGTKK